jgi:hypothetical protein
MVKVPATFPAAGVPVADAVVEGVADGVAEVVADGVAHGE